MKNARIRHTLACLTLAFGLIQGVVAQPASWLNLLNSDGKGRSVKLTEKDVVFAPCAETRFGEMVAVGYRQTDGTLTLGSLIWQGKVWSPMAGYAAILRQASFAEAKDEERKELFLSLLRATNEPLGIWTYRGQASREEDRPQPPATFRQVDGQHRFVVWYCEEPGLREGPEWRRVLYLVDASVPSVQARTLSSFHPVAEGLRGFPPIPSGSSE